MANSGPAVYYLVNARMRRFSLEICRRLANFAIQHVCSMQMSLQDNVVTEGKGQDIFQETEQTFGLI